MSPVWAFCRCLLIVIGLMYRYMQSPTYQSWFWHVLYLTELIVGGSSYTHCDVRKGSPRERRAPLFRIQMQARERGLRMCRPSHGKSPFLTVTTPAITRTHNPWDVYWSCFSDKEKELEKPLSSPSLTEPQDTFARWTLGRVPGAEWTAAQRGLVVNRQCFRNQQC